MKDCSNLLIEFRSINLDFDHDSHHNNSKENLAHKK